MLEEQHALIQRAKAERCYCALLARRQRRAELHAAALQHAQRQRDQAGVCSQRARAAPSLAARAVHRHAQLVVHDAPHGAVVEDGQAIRQGMHQPPVAARQQAVVAAHLPGVVLVPLAQRERGQQPRVGVLQIGKVPVQQPRLLLPRPRPTPVARQLLQRAAQRDQVGRRADVLAERVGGVQQRVEAPLDPPIQLRRHLAPVPPVQRALVADLVQLGAQLARERRQRVGVDACQHAAAQLAHRLAAAAAQPRGVHAPAGPAARLHQQDAQAEGLQLAGGGQSGETRAYHHDGAARTRPLLRLGLRDQAEVYAAVAVEEAVGGLQKR